MMTIVFLVICICLLFVVFFCLITAANTNRVGNFKKYYNVVGVKRQLGEMPFGRAVMVTLSLENKNNHSDKKYVNKVFYLAEYPLFYDWVRKYGTDENLIPTQEEFMFGYKFIDN